MPTTEIKRTEGAIWGRVLEPEKPMLTLAAARSILALDFPQADKDRMHELAAKARAGALLPGEEDEIDAYGRVGSILGIMKSRARQALKRTSNGRG